MLLTSESLQSCPAGVICAQQLRDGECSNVAQHTTKCSVCGLHVPSLEASVYQMGHHTANWLASACWQNPKGNPMQSIVRKKAYV